MTIAPFTLRSATTQSNAPFSIGHAFKKGDVPSGTQIAGSIPNLQVVAKNAWPDGSLKFAIVSGRANLTANTPLAVTLAPGTPTGGTALTIADLKATGITAAIGAGAFGSASWSGTDWDAPWQSWLSGPQMSSWIYRKQIGSDAHLVGFLEVRLFAGGAVEVLPWIENGYLQLPGSSISTTPTSKSATYTFTLDGAQRYSGAINLPARTRTPLINGAALSYWLAADPGVVPRHDVAYLQSTALVPSYMANTTSPSLQPSYTPLAAGGFTYPNDAMGGTGFSAPIGLLPTHDVLYMTSADTGAFASVVRNGFHAGRYPIYHRDEGTNRPLRFSTHTRASVNSSGVGQYPAGATGTVAPGWDVPHHPSMGYMAYLLTGHWYHMETVQFVATMNYLSQPDNVRQNGNGVFQTQSGASTVRGMAWAFRSLALAASATPDDDTALRAEFINSLEKNIDFYHGLYVAPSIKPNNFGFVAPYANYTNGTGRYSLSLWQQDFVTGACGFGLSLDIQLTTTGKTRFVEFFAWKAQSVIGRLQRANVITEYSYRDAAQVYAAVADHASTPNWFDPSAWYSTWRQVYEFDGKVNNEGDGPLRGGNFPSATSYWGNIYPAIAYAVQHNVDGADEAYARLTGASNYSLLQASFNETPVWGVQPLTSESTGEEPMPMNGPCILVDSASLRPDYLVVSGLYGIGLPESGLSTGHLNPPLGAGKYTGAPAGAELQMEVAPPAGGWPVGSSFVMYEDTSFSFTGAPDGVYTGVETIRMGGALDTGSYEFTIGEPPTSTVTGVVITPASASVAGGATQQFSTQVNGTGSPSQAVTWSKVSGVGTVNSSGLYTAPAATGSQQTATLRATSNQDTDFWDDVVITIAAAGTPTPTVTSVVVNPATATDSTVFEAVVNGDYSPSQAVTWSRSPSLGSIGSNGAFTRPAKTDSVQVITITATSVQDSSKSGTATVTIPALIAPPAEGNAALQTALDVTQFINSLALNQPDKRALTTMFYALIDDIAAVRRAMTIMAAKLDADSGVTGTDFVADATVPDDDVILGK